MVRILKVDAEAIREAAELVLTGRLIVFPTDTVYGLGCNPYDPRAVGRLVRVKQRAKGQLPVLVASSSEAARLGNFGSVALRLGQRFWPGPLTLVVEANAKLPVKVTGDSGYVGLRVPNHETAKRLIEQCGGSIVGTSANISGRPSPRTAGDAMRQLGRHIDLVLDEGPATLGKESTVVKVAGDEIAILREGGIPRHEILKTIHGTHGN